MPRLLALFMTMSALSLAACGDEEADTDVPSAGSVPAASTPSPAEEPAAADPEGACAPKQEDTGGKDLPCPTPSLIEGKDNVVVVTSSEGSFEITLDTERAPLTTNSFAYLTKEGLYDGTDFLRVVPDFVIQGGDPSGTQSGGPGYQVVEAPPADLKYTEGVVAMAKGGADPPGASGSQFYVVTGEDAGLPPEYALVGRVTKGMATVDKIDALGEGDGPPTKKVVIEKMELVGR